MPSQYVHRTDICDLFGRLSGQTAFAAYLRLEVGWLPQEAEMLHCKQPNQADAQSTCASDRHLRSVRKTKWTDSICSSPTTGGGLATTGGGDAALQATESGGCPVHICIRQASAMSSRKQDDRQHLQLTYDWRWAGYHRRRRCCIASKRIRPMPSAHVHQTDICDVIKKAR